MPVQRPQDLCHILGREAVAPPLCPSRRAATSLSARSLMRCCDSGDCARSTRSAQLAGTLQLFVDEIAKGRRPAWGWPLPPAVRLRHRRAASGLRSSSRHIRIFEYITQQPYGGRHAESSGALDRVVRVILGIILIAAPLLLSGSLFAAAWAFWLSDCVAIGALLLATAAVSFCPIYAALGLRTRART